MTVRVWGLQCGVAAHRAGRGAADPLAQNAGCSGVLPAAGRPITAWILLSAGMTPCGTVGKVGCALMQACLLFLLPQDCNVLHVCHCRHVTLPFGALSFSHPSFCIQHRVLVKSACFPLVICPFTKRMASASATQGDYRWAVSGTPIQNSPEELFSVLHFLRYSPFDTLAAWRNLLREAVLLKNPVSCGRESRQDYHSTNGLWRTLLSKSCIVGKPSEPSLGRTPHQAFGCSAQRMPLHKAPLLRARAVTCCGCVQDLRGAVHQAAQRTMLRKAALLHIPVRLASGFVPGDHWLTCPAQLVCGLCDEQDEQRLG